jgi:hypothetical protein
MNGQCVQTHMRVTTLLKVLTFISFIKHILISNFVNMRAEWGGLSRLNIFEDQEVPSAELFVKYFIGTLRQSVSCADVNRDLSCSRS